jgi:hypothetical protein
MVIWICAKTVKNGVIYSYPFCIVIIKVGLLAAPIESSNFHRATQQVKTISQRTHPPRSEVFPGWASISLRDFRRE